MPEVRISAESRIEFGKGAARRVRRSHRVPAVLYGHGTSPRHVSLPGHDLMLALKSANVLLLLEGLEGGSELALPKSVQRDPVSGHLEHVDLLLVRRGEKVTVEVPVHLVGEVTAEGMLDHQMVTLSVDAEATHIPQHIDVVVDGLGVGESVAAGDVLLPAGVALAADPAAVIVHVLPAPTAAQFDAELAEATAGAAPASDAGTAGAPAEPTAPAEAE